MLVGVNNIVAEKLDYSADDNEIVIRTYLKIIFGEQESAYAKR